MPFMKPVDQFSFKAISFWAKSFFIVRVHQFVIEFIISELIFGYIFQFETIVMVQKFIGYNYFFFSQDTLNQILVPLWCLFQ